MEREIATRQTLPRACTGYTRQALGLPCAHEPQLRAAVLRREPLSLDNVDTFWHLRRDAPPPPLQIRDPQPLPARARERPGMQREQTAAERAIAVRRCGHCREPGHTRTRCPELRPELR